MSKKLNLADRVLATGRNFQELGRDQDALRLLGRLAGWQHLAPDISEETLARLAEIHLAHGQYAQARHHLSALISLRPDNARYHHLLASTFDIDQRDGRQAAYESYRRSLELEPDQPDSCHRDRG